MCACVSVCVLCVCVRGYCKATARQPHGNSTADARQMHGDGKATAWPRYRRRLRHGRRHERDARSVYRKKQETTTRIAIAAACAGDRGRVMIMMSYSEQRNSLISRSTAKKAPRRPSMPLRSLGVEAPAWRRWLSEISGRGASRHPRRGTPHL